MMKLTLKEAVDNFRKQWNWIADETLRRKRKVEKEDFFDAHGIDEIDSPLSECYLCELADECDNCPIDWGKTNRCYCSLYGTWEKITRANYKSAARLAREIANLPLKEKYQEEYERIDIEIANELIKQVCEDYSISYGKRCGGFAKAIATVFEQAPTVEAEPVRHGKWIDTREDLYPRCSVCGEMSIDATYANKGMYCSSCGAKMDLKE